MHLLQREEEILQRGEVGEEVVGLEDDAELAAVGAEGGFAGEVDGLSIEGDGARIRLHEAGDDAEERGFPPAARADEGEGAQRTEIGGDAIEDGAGGVGFGEGGEGEAHGSVFSIQSPLGWRARFLNTEH